MQIRPAADPEMVKRILTSVKTPELRSLLLQIVQDHRINENARKRLSAYFSGQRPTKTRSLIRELIHKAFDQMKEI